MTNIQKLIAAAALYGVWLALVVMHLTPADGFVNALLSGLTALGVIHAQRGTDQ